MPIPAFPICMSAVLSVRLGNYYSISFDAQPAATAMLKRVLRLSSGWLYSTWIMHRNRRRAAFDAVRLISSFALFY